MLADYVLWDEVKHSVVCDLGGGNGQFLAELLRRFPAMRGAMLELEGTARVAQELYFGQRRHGEDEEESTEGKAAKGSRQQQPPPFVDVASRVLAVHAGDFFVEVPPYTVYTIRCVPSYPPLSTYTFSPAELTVYLF